MTEEQGEKQAQRAAVIFVGNRLMRDDAIGPKAYDLFCETYDIPQCVEAREAGCMSLDMLSLVDTCDLIITVDAVDGTEAEPGTVFRFSPDAMARHSGANMSLHDLKLVDLFDAAMLLGYSAEGVCYGMQTLDEEPEEYDMELTEPCQAALPLLVESVEAELFRHGIALSRKGA